MLLPLLTPRFINSVTIYVFPPELSAKRLSIQQPALSQPLSNRTRFCFIRATKKVVQELIEIHVAA